MLRANLLQFALCTMNIQCFRLNSRSSKNSALLNISSFYIHKEAPTFIWFPSIELCRHLRLLSVSLLKVQQISSLQVYCDVTLLYQAGFMPSCKLRYDYQPHGFRMHNTSQTHHPEHASETLGADDMWHAIMQIIKVNMTHFPPYERQFLSHSPNQLRHFHCITSGVCFQRSSMQSWWNDKSITSKVWEVLFFLKKEKINRERHFRAPVTAVGFKWVTGLTLLKILHKSLPPAHWHLSCVIHIKHWCGMKS